MGEHTKTSPHGNGKRERGRRLLNRFELKFYIAPHRMVEIAAERTTDMADYFVINARDRRYFVDDVHCLARSAYMQGIHDILDVIASGKVEELAAMASPCVDSRPQSV